MSTLSEFLLARIAEDEAATLTMVCECVDDPGPGCPARVLAECEAKRRIVEWMSRWQNDVALEGTLLLARPYAGHPDFDPAWRD